MFSFLFLEIGLSGDVLWAWQNDFLPFIPQPWHLATFHQPISGFDVTKKKPEVRCDRIELRIAKLDSNWDN